MATELDELLDSLVDVALGVCLGAGLVLMLLRPCNCGDDRTPTHGDGTGSSSTSAGPESSPSVVETPVAA